MAVYELHINGSEQYAKLSSFRADLELNGQDNIVAFILPDGASPETRFDIDDEVELLKDSVSIAAGLVTHVGEEMEPEGGPSNGRFLSRITVSGWGEIASRRHVSMSVVGGSPGTSVSDALTTLIGMTDGLGDDGVTLHPSQDTTRMITTAMVFEDALPTEILNTWARDTGQVWRIDELKRLRMWAKGDNPAAFDIDEDELPAKYFGDIRPSRARFAGYANRVIVKGIQQTILEYGETVVSTGVETVFTATEKMIGFSTGAVKVTNVPSLGVPLDGVKWETARLVGGPGSPIWEIDVAAKTFTRLDGPLPSGAIIRLIYDAEVSPRGVANDLADQGSPPVVRDEIVHAPVDNAADAQTLADQILPYFVAAKDTKAAYSTRETDLILPGDTQTMTVPSRGLSGAFLVERVTLRSGPGEMTSNRYLIQDIELTQNQVLKGDWRDLLNRFVVGPSGSTVNNGGGDSDGDTVTNPDGDGGDGSNLAIPPEDTDIIFNKMGALGTHRTGGSPTQGHAQIIYQDDAAVIAGGSPDVSNRMQMLLTTLSSVPSHSLHKWRSPDDEGVVSLTPWSTGYPGELIFGGEMVDDVYIARSEAVSFLFAYIDGPDNQFAIEHYTNQTIGSAVDFSAWMRFTLNQNIAEFRCSTRPGKFLGDKLGIFDQSGTGAFEIAIRAFSTLTADRELILQTGDATRTIRFDGVGSNVTFT